MRHVTTSSLGAALVCLAVATALASAQKPAPPASPAAVAPPPAAKPAPVSAHAPATPDHNAVVRRYCMTCHNEKRKVGGLSLEAFDVTRAADAAAVAEKMILKLQAGMMPPPGAARPDAAVGTALVQALEATIDTAAAARPNPGRRTFPRLNRAEYRRAIRELLDLDVDAAKWLPLDTMSANFDNIADEQALSPTLLEAYLNAAAEISRMAVGDRTARGIDHTYTNPSYVSQHPWDHVEGAPYGTRGGIVVDHVFPADGEYVFEVTLNGGDNARYEDIDISIDGERVALLPYETTPAGGADGRGANNIMTEPVVIRAGQQAVAAAFVRRSEGPYEDLIRPHDWSFAGGGSGGGGITTLPHLRDLIIRGPYKTTGLSQTPSRQKLFTCRPTSHDEEARCARDIVTRIAGEAYRRPIGLREVDRLMPFYEKGAAAGGFEGGVRAALEAILASPHFIFRLEREPETAQPGVTVPRRRHRPGLAAVVLHLGHAARPGAGRPRGPGQAVECRDARAADPAAAGRPARRGAGRALRGAVAAPAGHRQGQARPELLSQLRRQPGRADAARDAVCSSSIWCARTAASSTCIAPTTPS